MNDVIIISEVTHTGEVHFQVNSCFVEMISGLYPSQKIIFYAETNHNNAVKESLSNKQLNNLEFLPFEGYYDEKKFKWTSKIIGECIQIVKILRKGKLLKSELFVWTCLFPTGHFFLNFLLLFQKKSKHIIILHGELEFLKISGKRKSEVFLGIILKAGIYLSSKKTKYIVLGENIKKSLKKIVSHRILKRTHSILHPYNFSVDYYLKDLNNSNDQLLNIGAIGTQMLSKNSNYIYSLAEYYKADIIQDKINFITIGKILPELHPFETDLVKKLYSDSFVSQKNFEIEISKLNFIIFFYDNTAYELCASGAIFEAIRLDVPIISIKNDFFQWLFDSYGEMGFLCNNLDDIKLIIDGLKRDGFNEKLVNFRKNIAKFKNDNDLTSLAIKLKTII
ncbi:hypothetical protein KHA90_12895 [Flavobacterium psychroterrae]|uniref:Glycosyl transferase family 1 domain-containing protein n=1 Tax=Flavobacterium psychroterrae TaxID=2133767 RepID=A0ABS5PDX0_9FLAO|nr:hypothetical protein [Flavobacterium psychroterrae]MBS7231921.1 hypothetical protein [Flavobacterium psychroterrae]